MEEKKFVTFKKEELSVKEYIKKELGKGRISNVTIEYTPVGEKIIIGTSKPGLVIGRRGEKIDKLTNVLKKRFKLDNPHIEIKEITEPLLDAQLVADEIALLLERKGSLKFKVIAYKMLQEIIKTGALGTEIVLSGKLPSDRARTWRFTHGYLKKTGDPAKVVDVAQAQATAQSGVVGIVVKILAPDAHIHDRIDVNEELLNRIRVSVEEPEDLSEEQEKPEKKKRATKKAKVEDSEESKESKEKE
ncbi:30S ribosomal protein S3 [Candidatus Pacearchaeota archaeon]|nr:30S ribosomal protein S3 [Candidatus Pacearchaeota archaeon]|tara:strand:+ start:8701 stop:9438 length:738 start_codon:yes stop_codon:yes gene_type:complete